MRIFLAVFSLSLALLTGCGTATADKSGAGAVDGNTVDGDIAARPGPDAADSSSQPTPAANQADDTSRSTPKIAKPPPQGDLRTRKTGVDWPRFLGTHGDSKSPEQGVLTAWPKAGPRIVWQRQLYTGYGAPVVSRGRLYQFSRVKDNARLTCMRSETGEELWTFEYPTDYKDMLGYNNGPRCSPLVDGDRVYLFGSEGMLHCVNAIDGKMIWKVDTQKQFGVVQNFFGVGGAPWVEDDLLLVMVGGSPPESQEAGAGGRLDAVKSNGSGVVAFDKMTGRVKYYIGDELASYSGPVVTTIGDRRWAFVFARGGLLGFEPATGKIDFHFPWRAKMLDSVNASTPVVVGDQVLISETYGPGAALLKVRPGGYDVVWSDEKKGRDKSLQTHWNTPIHHKGYVYGSSGRHTPNAELRCVEWQTGKVMWTQGGLDRSSLLYVDEHFVCLTEYGDMLLLKANPEKLEVVASVTLTEKTAGPQLPGFGPRRLLEYPAWAAPILSHGLLYIRGKDRLVCLELIPEKKPDDS